MLEKLVDLLFFEVYAGLLVSHIRQLNGQLVDKWENVEALSDALDLDPDNMRLWLARAKVWQQQGDLAAAISDCYRAIQKSSEDQEPQALLEGLLREANIPQYRSILLPKR